MLLCACVATCSVQVGKSFMLMRFLFMNRNHTTFNQSAHSNTEISDRLVRQLIRPLIQHTPLTAYVKSNPKFDPLPNLAENLRVLLAELSGVACVMDFFPQKCANSIPGRTRASPSHTQNWFGLTGSVLDLRKIIDWSGRTSWSQN